MSDATVITNPNLVGSYRFPGADCDGILNCGKEHAMTNQVIRLALEWFKASGPKDRARLDGLVVHFATQYGETAVKQLQDDAWVAFNS